MDAGSSGVNGAHATETIMRCPHLYALKHIRGIDFGDQGPLVRGSIGHVALAHRYARKWAKSRGEDPDTFYEPLEAAEIAATKWGKMGEKMLPVIKNVYPSYEQRYTDEDWEIVDVENVLVMEVGKYTHTQRADTVVRRENGKIYIPDHKFVSRVTDDTINRYTLSTQFVGYSLLGRLHYENFGGVIANIVGCHDGRFLRQVVDPAPEAVRTFKNTIIEARERKEKWEERDPKGFSWPKALSETVCITPYGMCPAFQSCQWGGLS